MFSPSHPASPYYIHTSGPSPSVAGYYNSAGDTADGYHNPPEISKVHSTHSPRESNVSSEEIAYLPRDLPRIILEFCNLTDSISQHALVHKTRLLQM